MITLKKMEKLAHNYRLSRSWDEKVAIIREVYDNSIKENRKTNLVYFGRLVNEDFKILYQKGQLELYNIRKSQERKNQDVSFQTAKANLERKKNPKGKKQKQKFNSSIFKEETEVGNYTKAGSSGGKYSRRDAQIYSSLK